MDTPSRPIWEGNDQCRQVHTLRSHSCPGNTAIRATLRRVHITCTRSDRTFPQGIRQSARLCVKCASGAHARITLFPREYCDPCNFASGAHRMYALASHSFPRNTSIRGAVHPAKVNRTRPDRTLSGGILRSAQLGTNRTPGVHTRNALFPGKYVDPYTFACHGVYTRQVHITCARSDYALSRGIRRSAQLHIK